MKQKIIIRCIYDTGSAKLAQEVIQEYLDIGWKIVISDNANELLMVVLNKEEDE